MGSDWSENCDFCSGSDECKQECDNVNGPTKKLTRLGCDVYCKLGGKCYLWNKKTFDCYCLSGCDNDANGDINPIRYHDYDYNSTNMVEAYGIGVLSTFIILLLGIFILFICKKVLRKENKNDNVNYAFDDDEQICINK